LELEKSRLDNWPERVLKNNNIETVLNPLKISQNTKSSLLQSISNHTSTDYTISNQVLNSDNRYIGNKELDFTKK